MDEIPQKEAKPVILTPALMKILSALVAVLIFSVIVYFFSGMPAPKEKDRVHTIGDQISIIAPPKWVPQVVYGPRDKQYLITVEVRQPNTLDVVEHLFVAKRREPLTEEQFKKNGFAPGEFQGKPAYLKTEQRKREYVWQAVFEREGNWYEVRLVQRRALVVESSPWWAYLNSFKYKPGPTTIPTGPASVPAFY